MAYIERDPHLLDKTTAWVTGCLALVVIVAISWAASNYRYTQETERKAIEAGYCMERDSNATFTGYHWQKCK